MKKKLNNDWVSLKSEQVEIAGKLITVYKWVDEDGSTVQMMNFFGRR